MAQIKFTHEGETVSECTEELRLFPRLSFPDAVCDKFDELMVGSKVGDKKEATLTISHDAANEDLRGKDVKAEIEVLDVKKMKLPTLDDATLKTLGDFDSEGDLRDAAKADLERRLGYQQQKRVREQITALLTDSAEWDLPKDLLRRQSHRELERAVMELRSAGYGPDEIRAYENELRQNSMESTKRALKEHFILERIAEDESIEEAPEDYEAEIALIAAQTREPIRRVRARIEKQGLMDALRNQIIERKVIEKITSAAKFKDVPYQVEDNQVFAVDHIVSGVKDSVIPVAKHGGETEQLREPADRT
jgi:trigger factor